MTLQASIQLQNRMSKPLRAITNSMNIIISTFETMETASSHPVDVAALQAARAQINGIEADFIQASDAVEQTRKKQESLNNAVRRGGDEVNKLEGRMKGIAMSIAAVFSVQKMTALSDAVTQTTARLNLMNDGLQSTKLLNLKIFASAQRARAPYLETASAIAKMGLNAGNAFQSNDELIAFMEQVNKQFVIGGASTQEQSNAMIQLSQAMAAGALRGEELNSILDAAPGIARTIEQNMGWAEGSIKQYAEKGAVSAQVVKSSLLNMAQETNYKFNSMPMTFGQVVNAVQNTLLQAFHPAIQFIGQGASFINERWSTIEPIFYGVAAGAVALAIGLGIQAAATWIATGAAQTFFATLMANPLFWVVLIIGAVVAAIYKWVQSVGGIRVAWAIVVDAVLTKAGQLKIGFVYIWNQLQNGIDSMQYGFASFKAGVLNTLGNLKVMGLSIMQDFINGAIDRINRLINMANSIAGTSIETISRVEFATNAAVEEKGKQKQRAADLAAMQDQNNANRVARQAEANEMIRQYDRSRMQRKADIEAAKADAARKAAESDNLNVEAIAANTGNTAGNTAAMADSMNLLDEDLKYMRDAAEQEVINRFTLAELKVDVNNNNTLTTRTDFDDVNRMLGEVTGEILDVAAEGGLI